MSRANFRNGSRAVGGFEIVQRQREIYLKLRIYYLLFENNNFRQCMNILNLNFENTYEFVFELVDYRALLNFSLWDRSICTGNIAHNESHRIKKKSKNASNLFIMETRKNVRG